jgi:hypothetical protein
MLWFINNFIVTYKNCFFIKDHMAPSALPWVPEPLVIEVRTRRGGSGHTSIQPHFGEFNIWTLFVIGQYLCESFHWLTDAHRLTSEKTHINIDQSQTEFEYWTHQSEAGCLCDQSLLVMSSLLSQEALAPRILLPKKACRIYQTRPIPLKCVTCHKCCPHLISVPQWAPYISGVRSWLLKVKPVSC